MEARANLSTSQAVRKAVDPSKQRQEALTRATSGQSCSNFPVIFAGFAAKGIPESEIHPRENVFTYDAWKALGRQVKRGEHGVRVLTFVACKKTDRTTGEEHAYRRPWRTTVFHVSQTDTIKGGGL